MDAADHTSPVVLSGTVTQIRTRTLEATSRMLGDTIALSDVEWQRPSALPWWTRAHVATHLARNADGLGAVLDGVEAGRARSMYESDVDRASAIERGSLRAGLDIQIDLDTSAGQLSERLSKLAESASDPAVDLGLGLDTTVHHIPLIRLGEVVLHHADLLLGFTIDQVPDDVARWLLEWRCHLLAGQPGSPPMVIASESGLSVRVGSAGPAQTIHGTDAQLLGWLVGRPTRVLPQGTDALPMPSPA